MPRLAAWRTGGACDKSRHAICIENSYLVRVKRRIGAPTAVHVKPRSSIHYDIMNTYSEAVTVLRHSRQAQAPGS